MRLFRLGYQPIGWSSAIVFLLLIASACHAPVAEIEPTELGELDGAWSLVSSETRVPDGTRYPGTTHESFLLIADGYYSMNWAFGSEASDYFSKRFSPTDDEKIARYQTLLVNAGNFDLDAGVLTIHPTFALVPEYVGGIGEFDYSFDGETLELIWKKIESADGVPDPNTAVGVQYVSRWQRISGQANPY